MNRRLDRQTDSEMDDSAVYLLPTGNGVNESNCMNINFKLCVAHLRTTHHHFIKVENQTNLDWKLKELVIAKV